MQLIISTFTTIVAAGLMWLTVRGAHALTGSLPMTVVLAALVAVQWASARMAIAAFRASTHAFGGRLLRALGFGAIWLVAATITVSFVGGELFEMFSATNTATERFEAEQSTLRQRGRELGQALQMSMTVAEQYAAHAKDMAEQEKQHGGSCAVSMGSGPGDIRAFRQADSHAAQSLLQQLKPQADGAQQALQQVDALKFSGEVGVLRQQMGRTADDLNGLLRSQLWGDVLAFVASSDTAANHIKFRGVPFACEDRARSLLLDQMKRGAELVGQMNPVAPAQLLDHKDSRAIVQATLVRTWAAALGLLPKSLWAGKPLLDAKLRQRFEVKEDVVLSSSNLTVIMAWVLEGILICLLVLGDSQRKAVTVPGPAARLRHWAGAKLSACPGIAGEAARTLTQPGSAISARPPYVNSAILFDDAAMEERACTVARYYMPWGGRDIVVIPMAQQVAVRAARELQHACLLRRLASGLPSNELQRNAQLAAVMRVMSGPVPETVWEVYEVADPHFARWLLSQPVEARAALAAHA